MKHKVFECMMMYDYDDETYRRYSENLIDLDDDREALRIRVNKHFTDPMLLNFNRNCRFTLELGEYESQIFNREGGGAPYQTWLELRTDYDTTVRT